MPSSSPSALITDQGQRVLLRLQGRFYELTQPELRTLLGLSPGPPGLGISIDGDRFRFEFPADEATQRFWRFEMPSVSSSPTTRIRAPSFRLSLPPTMSFSDEANPPRTSTRSPTLAPTSTSRCCARPVS